MNSQKKKILKEIEAKKQIKEGEQKNDNLSSEALTALQNLRDFELSARRVTDELNRLLFNLCGSCATLIKEKDELKKQLKGKTDAPTE
ncbi:MAG: hypothetical protein ACWGNI_00095 [Desulfobacterales bacterium]